MQLNAAELWNSNKSSSGKSKGSYYNSRSSDGRGITLYNRKNPDRSMASSGLRSNIRTYRNINIAREQKASRLWQTMSPSAIINRQADTDNALQHEYNSRKRMKNLMVAAAKNRSAYRLAGNKRHKANLERVRSERLAKKQALWAKKNRALQRVDDTWHSRKYHKARVKERNTSLKKPKRLFNDPND